jgi:hypothetical protein
MNLPIKLEWLLLNKFVVLYKIKYIFISFDNESIFLRIATKLKYLQQNKNDDLFKLDKNRHKWLNEVQV